MPKTEKYSVDLNSPIPDLKERLKAQIGVLNDFTDIRPPRQQISEIEGSNPSEQYAHHEAHVFWVEEPLEDLIFLNSSQLPHIKALQNQARKSLRQIIPTEKINSEEIQKAERWYNIQTFIVEAIQFLEGFGQTNSNKEIKSEMMLKIYNRNLKNIDYIADDWVSLLERNRYNPNDELDSKKITPKNYKKYILKEGIGYRELDNDQYISFDVLELYKKQVPINFEDLVKIAEQTCKVRREIREKYKPDSN
jgi:hypothetical protein